MARIAGSLDPKVTRYGWYEGQAVVDLLNIRGLDASRIVPHPSGTGYMNLRREVGYFFDPKTGRTVDRWTNPLSDETVEVIHIANDPVNVAIEPTFPRRTYCRDDKLGQMPPEPFILPWPGDPVLLSFASCGRCRGCGLGRPASCSEFAALLGTLAPGGRLDLAAIAPADALLDAAPHPLEVTW